MKNFIYVLAILGSLFIFVIPSQAANVGFSVKVNLSNASGQVVMDEPPVFIEPSSLGFYVAVGIPYDMFFISSSYYMHKDGRWYVASSYNGPWAVIQYGRLPRGLRMHRYKQIISIRDQEYRSYQNDRDHYRGKQYRPERRVIRQEKKADNRGENRNKVQGDKEDNRDEKHNNGRDEK